MFLNLSSLLTNANLTPSMVYNQLLVQLGSTYITDTLFLISSCINLIGLCLNLLSIRVLFDEKFKSSIKLFGYMKVYLVNSISICIMLLPAFLISRRFWFANEPYGTMYSCYIYAPLVTACSVCVLGTTRRGRRFGPHNAFHTQV
jgi:hypothetical protein